MMIKMMIGLLIIACLAPLFLKDSEGEPIMRLSDWLPELPETATSVLEDLDSTNDSRAAAPVEVYRWQDEDGVWQFSDTPIDTQDAEKIAISEVNVMDAWVDDSQVRDNQGASSSQKPTMPSGVSVSANQLETMMDTVTNLQQTIDDRKADMDAIALPPQ